MCVHWNALNSCDFSLQHCVLVSSKGKNMVAFESRLSAVTQIICPIKLLIRECSAMLHSHSLSSLCLSLSDFFVDELGKLLENASILYTGVLHS